MRGINSGEKGSGETQRDRKSAMAISNDQRLRMFVLREILDTERDYVNLLEFMVQVRSCCQLKFLDN